jgi:hypothetical protein
VAGPGMWHALMIVSQARVCQALCQSTTLPSSSQEHIKHCVAHRQEQQILGPIGCLRCSWTCPVYTLSLRSWVLLQP